MKVSDQPKDSPDISPWAQKEPLLKYVVFFLEDNESGTISSSKQKLLISAFGIVIVIASLFLSKPFIEKFILSENIFWVNSPHHSLIENFGGLISVVIALILSWEYSASGKKNVLFLAIAFFAMGILDIFHAFSDYCHNMFVWFHSFSALFGSFFIFVSILFISKGIDIWPQAIWKRRLLILSGIASIFFFTILSNNFHSDLPDVLKMKLPHHTPVVEVKGHFSNFIYFINFISSILFLGSGIFFAKGFLKTNDVIYLIFAISALLFFESELSFTFSKLWDPIWWYWHVIKLVIYSGLLFGLIYGFTRTFHGLYTSKRTMSKLLEDIENKNIELIKAYENLKENQRYLNESEKLASIGKIAASVAHEIRNPLGAITNSLEVLKRYSSLSFEDLELFEIVDNEIDRLNKLVEDFLDYSKASRLDKVETDIHALINETLYMFKMHKKVASHFTIKNSFTSDVPFIRLDRNKIKQVLLNIYNNAIQAMPDAGGVLSISSRYKKQEDEVEITVNDNGKGMSDDVLLRVFEPFFSTKDKGMGLGLNIAYKIVKEHGGYILISSEVDKGTQIKLYLPVENEDISLKENKEIKTLSESEI